MNQLLSKIQHTLFSKPILVFRFNFWVPHFLRKTITLHRSLLKPVEVILKVCKNDLMNALMDINGSRPAETYNGELTEKWFS